MTRQLVIFDCDGVLVDSEPVANGLMTARLQEEGLGWSEEEVSRRFTGRSMPSCVAEIERELGRPLSPDWVERLQVDTFAAFREELQAVQGVQRVIDAVGRRGWSDCVASSGEHEKMKLTLRLTGMLEHFGSRRFSSTDVSRGKPAPDLFLHAASSLDFRPEQCWVIEDSAPGVRAAVAAGMRVFGYAAEGPGAELKAAGAELFSDMEQFAKSIAATFMEWSS